MARSVTEMLQRFSEGDRDAADEALRLLMPKLREAAAYRLYVEGRTLGMSPTELINETWAQNLGHGGWRVNNREHFVALASTAMRLVLVDLARHHIAQRRHPNSRLQPFVDERTVVPQAATAEQVVALDLLMDRLEAKDAVAARVAEMHYFAGFSFEEISSVTKLSPRQVRHQWSKAKVFLQRRLAASV